MHMGPPPPEHDKPREACGVVAVLSFNDDAVEYAHAALGELQHRGQDASGITAVDKFGQLHTYKDLGLVKDVFQNGSLLQEVLPSDAQIAIGHDRYGTMTSVTDKLRAAQPLGDEECAIAHNGHFSNIDRVLAEAGFEPSDYVSDSEGLLLLLKQHMSRSGDKDLANALRRVLPRLQGAFSITATDGERIIGVRDPNGFRPLAIGRLANESGYAFASETPALERIGAKFEREVGPGEMVIIDPFGATSEQLVPANESLCLYEFIYFSGPENVFGGQRVGDVRLRLGQELAREHPVIGSGDDDDIETIVVGVPKSGLISAEGYAEGINAPLIPAIKRNDKEEVPRTFILSTQEAREEAASRKYLVDAAQVKGKRCVIADDSIIHGTTFKQLVKQLREAGAAEIHVRIPAPPYRFPCFFGMDTGDRDELIAANLDIAGLKDYFNVDSIEYLSVEGVQRAVARPIGSVCMACCTGDYPIPIPVTLGERTTVAV